VAAEKATEARAAAQAAARQQEAEVAALPDEEILAKYDLPEPEALESPEAVKEFLSHGLPQRLKTRALRRLWRLNPVLANLDGLVDYDEDFTDAATVVENLQTAYQVGKGMLAHVEAMAAQEKAKAEPGEAEDGETQHAPEAEDDTPLLAEASPAPAYRFQDDEEGAAPTPGPARRRMTFQFQEHT
jgi:hypothetical protein